MRQLKAHSSDREKGRGPWHVDRDDVIAFRTRKDFGDDVMAIEVLFRGNHTIFVDDCPENMEWLQGKGGE
jgi:hypothetical protein